MACYTAHLASGATLLCKTIKSDTIKRYLSAASELSAPAQMMNPTLDLMGNLSVFIKDIIHEVKRWETMPNRREPLTKEMTEYILDKGEKSKKTNPDNLYSAMGDWLILGEQAGFRRKEWAQDRTYLHKHKEFQRNVDGSSAAFILTDMEFRAQKNKIINNNSMAEIKKSQEC